ncbi:MAG: guanylate kinase [Planctomycetota bacterium]|jgi:guanylate kinase
MEATRPEHARAGATSRGLLLVVSGPSGVGKTSIVREVITQLGGRFSVSATTRPRSETEVEGKDYFFLDEARFEDMRQHGEFLEYAQVFGKHWYGTPREPIEQALQQGELIILDIDVQGAQQVRQSMPESLMVFVLPPSEEELLRRLRKRGREAEEVIQRRFQEAKREIDLARRSDVYDHLIVNDDLPRAIEHTCSIIRERMQ